MHDALQHTAMVQCRTRNDKPKAVPHLCTHASDQPSNWATNWLADQHIKHLRTRQCQAIRISSNTAINQEAEDGSCGNLKEIWQAGTPLDCLGSLAVFRQDVAQNLSFDASANEHILCFGVQSYRWPKPSAACHASLTAT